MHHRLQHRLLLVLLRLPEDVPQDLQVLRLLHHLHRHRLRVLLQLSQECVQVVHARDHVRDLVELKLRVAPPDHVLDLYHHLLQVRRVDETQRDVLVDLRLVPNQNVVPLLLVFRLSNDLHVYRPLLL